MTIIYPIDKILYWMGLVPSENGDDDKGDELSKVIISCNPCQSNYELENGYR